MTTKPLPSLDALYLFEAAARLQSFKLAAAERHLSATAISHAIRKLEAALGCALFVRQVRAVTLTPEGERLLAAVQSGLQTIAGAITAIRHSARHTVTLSVTPEFAALWLVPKLAAFQAQHPAIDLHIHTSYQPVDLPAGMADLAVRYGHGDDANLVALPLFRETFAPVAAPALARTLARDARQWPLIHMDWHHKKLAHDWASWARAAAIDPAALQDGVRYFDGSHAVQAALGGQGVALLGLSLLHDLLQQNLLTIVAAPHLPAAAFHVCAARNRPLSAAALQVRDWLLAQR